MQSLRPAVEKLLSEELPDETWEVLDRRLGFDDPELYDAADLASMVRQLRSPGERGRRKVTTPLSESLSNRSGALSCVLAAHAKGHPTVVEFRRQFLPDGLLERKELRPWIMERLFEEIRQDAVMRGRDPGQAERAATYGDDTATVRLRFQDPPGEWDSEWRDQDMDVIAGRILFKLSLCSWELAREYGWSEYEATTFVLCGGIPFRPAIRAEFLSSDISSAWRDPTDAWEGTPRIAITVDASSVTPGELAEWYRELRRSVVDHKKVQPQDYKHLRLAAFCADRAEGESWDETMARWNAEFPEWHYSIDQRWNFVRDATMARKRLLKPACIISPAPDQE